MQLNACRATMLRAAVFRATVLLVALTSCSRPDDAAAPLVDHSVTEEAPQPPDLSAGRDGAARSAEPLPTAAIAPCPEAASCFGPLVVRPEAFAMSREGATSLLVRGVLSLENRRGEPINIALSHDPIIFNLDNGAQVAADYRQISGLAVCGRGVEAQPCFDTMASNFVGLSKDDSPTKINFSMRGRYDPSLEPTIPGVERGVLTFRIFVVPAGEAARPVRISIDRVTVLNQLAR